MPSIEKALTDNYIDMLTNNLNLDPKKVDKFEEIYRDATIYNLD